MGDKGITGDIGAAAGSARQRDEDEGKGRPGQP
jgi:hypothetical protein